MDFRIKEILKNQGLTMEKLSDMLGITRITLTRNINGNPTIETLQKIADALHVPISELFTAPDERTIVCPKCGTKLEVKAKE